MSHLFSLKKKITWLRSCFLHSAAILQTEVNKFLVHLLVIMRNMMMFVSYNIINSKKSKKSHQHAFFTLMCGSCHFNRALNDKFSVECFFWFFQLTWKSDLEVVQITKNDLFWVNAPLQYLECAPNCKTRAQLKKMIMTIFDIQHQFWHLMLCPNDMNQTLKLQNK